MWKSHGRWDPIFSPKNYVCLYLFLTTPMTFRWKFLNSTDSWNNPAVGSLLDSYGILMDFWTVNNDQASKWWWKNANNDVLKLVSGLVQWTDTQTCNIMKKKHPTPLLKMFPGPGDWKPLHEASPECQALHELSSTQIWRLMIKEGYMFDVSCDCTFP